MRLLQQLCTVALALVIASTADAGQPFKEIRALPELNPFDKGARELQVGVGPMFAANPRGGRRPRIDDLDAAVRLGWMLTDPRGSGFLAGNVELLVEAVGGVVIEGPGNGFGGVTLRLRYNFVQPDTSAEAKWVPYFQIGAGGIYNDIYKDQAQGLIGGALEFNLYVGAGVRYFFSPRVAGFVEADLRHISNANFHDRNFGMNSVGGLAGVSWFF
jgi:hypothetical protein